MTKLKIGVALAALALAACGGDETKNNTSNNTTANNTTNTTSTNNTSGTNNTPTNNTTPTNNNSTNTNNGTPLLDPPTCADANPPARCTDDPATRTWAPASVVDTFIVEGTDTDPICCYDYNGDGDIDNSLGFNLAGLGFLADINSSISDSIASGSLALVLEHDGLTDLANQADFVIGFYIAEHDVADFATTGFQANSNPVLLNAASFDQGSQPQAYLPFASNTGGSVTAGPGAVKIEITLFDSPLRLTISQARSDATIDTANSALDASGVALSAGQLGGVVKIRDIFVAVNEFAAGSCECLGLGAEQLVDPDTGTCSANADAAACETAGNATCKEVAGACSLFGAVGLFADVDLDGDGLNESVSIGAGYTAVGATINGIAP